MTNSDQGVAANDGFTTAFTMTNITQVLGEDGRPPIAYIPEDMAQVHLITYQILYPILIVFGIITNGLTIVITNRPKLRNYHVNSYIQLLAITDLLGCVVCIPAAMSAGDCAFHNYAMAVYFAHCCWSLVNLTKTLSFYVIIWMAYDRFLAVWAYTSFKNVEKPGVLRNRILLSTIVCVGVYVPIMINGEVECLGDGCSELIKSGFGDAMILASEHGVVVNKTVAVAASEIVVPDISLLDITTVYWLAIDGYSLNFEKTWHRVFMVIHGLLVNWLPGLLLVFLSAALMVALAIGKLKNTASNTKRKSKQFLQTVTLLTIAVSFIICSLPITVVILFISDKKQGLCYVSFNIEVIRAIGSLLQMMWNNFNVLTIFILNAEYKLELEETLKMVPLIGKRVTNMCFKHREDEIEPDFEEMVERTTPAKTASNNPTFV
ncbi:unnamed protein product [Meganyctiphanes norvegica]|uniref:G-protein coupled receptors family 1 profile domain-containing protein n=1 Tax=Meganyctiphanes norvegica TaxID=48144 RepID=A0AAV2RZ06_MEGNR